MCNGTLFRVEIQLDDHPNETSWELIDVKTYDIIDNASYQEEDRFELVHEEMCVEPGPYIFILYASARDSIDCSLRSCYNIFINNDMVINGSTFRSQISHRFDSSPYSVCFIQSTFLLELHLDHKNLNLIETPILNDNYTNAFYACLSPGMYVMDALNIFDFPAPGCGWSGCFQVSINN